MELSKRLQAVADMLSKGKVVADIGTDHGYIPIHLIQSNKCEKVYAMDINKGPYEKAKLHIAGNGLSSQITTRLSDGMKALNQGEVNAIIIAGMGGGLVIKILEQDKRLWDEIDEFVLQPQSELHKVREYLQENKFKIVEENMIYEDGKYYPMLKVEKGTDSAYTNSELMYGKLLIRERNPILSEFLEKEIQVKKSILDKLSNQRMAMIREEKINQKEKDDVDVQAHTVNEKITTICNRMDEIQREVDMAYEVQRNM